jgi:hypothetical protein
MTCEMLLTSLAKHWGGKMTEASRVQNLLNEQNSEIIFLKSQVSRQNLDIVGYRVRITQLEAALTHVYAWWPISTFNPHQTIKEIKEFAREALEGKDV